MNNAAQNASDKVAAMLSTRGVTARRISVSPASPGSDWDLTVSMWFDDKASADKAAAIRLGRAQMVRKSHPKYGHSVKVRLSA